jgi:UDP-N-acetyl-D-glucosamine dehydrogenase
VPLTDDLLRSVDAVMVVTDHSSIDYGRVCNLASIVIDTRNACGVRATPGVPAPSVPAHV